MDVLVIGAGGHACVVAEAVEAGAPDTRVVGFLDDDTARHGGVVLGKPVLGSTSDVQRHPHDALALGIGDNASRARVSRRLSERGELVITVVHPRAWVSPSAVLGGGAVVLAHAAICACAEVGEGAIVNTGATVDHHCVIGAYAHVAPGAHLAGGCRIGESCLIGVGAVLAPGRSVGARTVVGVGAAVVRDLPPDVVGYGVPARARTAARGRTGATEVEKG